MQLGNQLNETLVFFFSFTSKVKTPVSAKLYESSGLSVCALTLKKEGAVCGYSDTAKSTLCNVFLTTAH